jgi:MFS family permease
MTLQAAGLGWLALIIDPTNSFTQLIAPFMMSGAGMALVFPTAAATVLSAVRPIEAGKASGANNAIREIGGVMGVAVLASVFAANGGYGSPQSFTDGVDAALPVAVVVLSIGAVLALLVPGKARSREPEGNSTTASAPHSSATLQEGTA